MIAIYYKNINEDLDEKIQKLAERIRKEGIAVEVDCKTPQKVNYILVLIESIWKYIEEKQKDPEFEKILCEIGKESHNIICITYQKYEDFKNVAYVKKRNVLFLMKDYNKLLKTIKPINNFKKIKKRFNSVIVSLMSGFTLISIITIIYNFMIKEPDIPAPQLEIKWEYLSAYDYNYIVELNNVKVVKKGKDLIKNLIALNKNENVIVGTIIIKNSKEEYPEHLKVNLKRIQDGKVYKDEINLKTISHNNYIMIPLFITEKFPEEFVNKRIPPSITKEQILDAIDTRIVYTPISINYKKARFWEWNNEESLIVEESSDVLSEWEILIKIDEDDQKKDIITEEKSEEDSEDTKEYMPKIYKSKIIGQ